MILVIFLCTFQWMRMTVQLTSNHLGYFEFRLCPKQSADQLVTQECLDRHLLTLADGSTRFYVTSETGLFFPVAQLPSDVVCDHCVLQWRYTAGINDSSNSISIDLILFCLLPGNNWGVCKDGIGGLGCGPQETFVNCADIAII